MEDFDEICRMGQQFHALSCYAEIMPCDRDSMHAVVEHLLREQPRGGVLLVAEREGSGLCGMIAALAYPCWYNRAARVAQELFWWVDEDCRGSRVGMRLFDALERWAHACGAATLTMASTANLNPEALAGLYMRRGYVPQDVLYTKRV